ncbi:MAG: BamA/TamA family outer membrane protein [Deltaproteobacteria bacterium]|nr:BamA/TamA family outer membrane protein [Deltaproteobacteria bacterium]
MRRFALILGALLVLAAEGLASAQVLVFPRRANKTRVRYFDFDWKHVDILVGLDANTLDADRVAVEILTDPDRLRRGQDVRTGTAARARSSSVSAALALGGIETTTTSTTRANVRIVADLEQVDREKLDLGSYTGGVRLFFYEGERPAAQHAAASIEDSYRYLVQKFRYIPERTFPYILYNSYQEFLQTNLFPVQEGVLGVTSTRGDLRLTLPYFGDFQYFRDVSVHEMAHQFTIQKVHSYADRSGGRGDPLERMPLWFIEGIAEFYAKSGLDNEAEMLVRDIVLNPDVENGYAMLDFWADRPGSVLWTYKVGQIRCVFLEETYGAGFLQTILEKSPRMIAANDDEARVANFVELLEKLTTDEARLIGIKFERWLKSRAFKNYLEVKQGLADLEPLEISEEYVDALNASPSGLLVMYRSYDLVTGKAQLTLVDHRAMSDDTVVVTDNSPGVESLHPIAARTFDLTDQSLVFLAEAGGSDVLYWQSFEHRATKIVPEEVLSPADELRRRRGEIPAEPPPKPKERWEADIDLGARIAFRLREHQIFAAYSPALAPDGRRVAFVGLGVSGDRDLYVLAPRGDDGDYALQQLTHDGYAERDVAWGPGGIVFSSDATAHHSHNLFRVDPDRPGSLERITAEDRDHFHPVATRDGRIFFVAYENGSANIYEALPQGWVRRTDIATGFFSLAPAPDGGLWALLHHSGRRVVVRLPDKMLTLADLRVRTEDTGPPWRVPKSELGASVAYNPLAIKNWELGTIFGILGAGPGGVYGQAIASANDRLNNHALILQLAISGSLELLDGYLIYLNQEGRLSWGAGPFQSLRLRIDRTFEREVPGLRFISFERFFGAQGVLRYPFNRYVYLQGELAVGGSGYVLAAPERELLADRCNNGTTSAEQCSLNNPPPESRDLSVEWEDRNGGVRFQTEGSLSFGYDTIAYNRGTGPIAGNAVLLEGTVGVQPFDDQLYGSVRLDAEQYFPLFGRSNLFFRMGAGTNLGGKPPKQYYLSSFDTLRGVPFGLTSSLVGQSFLFTTAELQIPLNLLIRFLLFSDVEGIVGLDFGTVSDSFETFFDKRVMDFVLGFNLGLGPLVFRLHFAKPINVGVPYPNGDGSWVTNFSLGWLYF